MIRFLGIICFMAVPYFEWAADNDSSRVIKLLFPTNSVGESVVQGTQAAMLYAYERSVTRIALATRYRNESRAFMPQLGSGETKGIFSVDSYIRLDRKRVVWGSVEYSNGKIRDVCWNSSLDFLQLYPYVMADSIGGNLASEQYLFSGGYAMQCGRFTFGIKGHYRALHEYRKEDPRPRGVVSDFKADLSVGLGIGGYLLGVNAAGRVYKQFMDVVFYDERGSNTAEMHFTGLGSHYERFGGADDYSSVRYRGREYSATLSFTPCHNKGWYAGACYRVFTIKRHLPTQNMVPLTTLRIEKLCGRVAYKGNPGVAEWGVEGNVVYEKRIGVENIIDNGAGNENLILGSLAMYKNRNITAGIVGKILFNRRNGKIWFDAGADYRKLRAEYLFPHKEMRFATVVPFVYVGCVRFFDKWSYEVALRMAYGVNVSGEIDIPVRHIDAKIRTSLMELYGRLTDNYFRIDPKVKIQHEIMAKTAAYIMINYSRFMYSSREKADLLTASIGLCF